jgi:hypothetical protein
VAGREELARGPRPAPFIPALLGHVQPRPLHCVSREQVAVQSHEHTPVDSAAISVLHSPILRKHMLIRHMWQYFSCCIVRKKKSSEYKVVIRHEEELGKLIGLAVSWSKIHTLAGLPPPPPPNNK